MGLGVLWAYEGGEVERVFDSRTRCLDMRGERSIWAWYPIKSSEKTRRGLSFLWGT